MTAQAFSDRVPYLDNLSTGLSLADTITLRDWRRRADTRQRGSAGQRIRGQTVYLSQKASRARLKEVENARANRLEIVKAYSCGQITRRDLI
jgi:hypothetical protein